MLPDIGTFAFRLCDPGDLSRHAFEPSVELIFQGRFDHRRPCSGEKSEDFDSFLHDDSLSLKSRSNTRPCRPYLLEHSELKISRWYETGGKHDGIDVTVFLPQRTATICVIGPKANNFLGEGAITQKSLKRVIPLPSK